MERIKLMEIDEVNFYKVYQNFPSGKVALGLEVRLPFGSFKNIITQFCFDFVLEAD